MPNASDLVSTRTPSSPEATTAAALFAICEKLALSDEPGSTNMATEISTRANIIAKLEIRFRTPEFITVKNGVDTAAGELIRTIQQISQARQLVIKAREIAAKVDDLIRISADLIP